MDDANQCPNCDQLLRLSLECYKSLRRKYPARMHWTPEFEEWKAVLERMSGKDLKGVLVGEPNQMSSAWVLNEG